MKRKDKIGIIFGATGKIGSKISEALTKKGVKLIVQGKNKIKLEQLDDKMKKIGGNPTLLNLDVSDEKNYENLGLIVEKRFGYIDFYINLISSINKLTPLTDLSSKDWNNLMEINLNSKWRILKHLELLMKRSYNPSVYLFVNEKALNAKPYFHAYGVAQFGIKAIIEIYKNEKNKFNFNAELIRKSDFKLEKFVEKILR